MAMPDAAIAPARPVGLRVVDFFQGRFFSFVAPFVVVDMRDTTSESRGGNNEALPFADSNVDEGCTEGNSGARSAVGDSTIGVIVIVLPLSPRPVSRDVSGDVAERIWLVLMLSDRFEAECRTSFEGCWGVLGMADDVFPLPCLLSVEDGVAGRERESVVGNFEVVIFGDGADGTMGVGVGVMSSEDSGRVTGVVRVRPKPDNSPASLSVRFTSLTCRSDVSAKL